MEWHRGVCLGRRMKVLTMIAFTDIEDKTMREENGFYFPRFARYESWHTRQNANRIPAGAVILAWLT